MDIIVRAVLDIALVSFFTITNVWILDGRPSSASSGCFNFYRVMVLLLLMQYMSTYALLATIPILIGVMAWCCLPSIIKVFKSACDDDDDDNNNTTTNVIVQHRNAAMINFLPCLTYHPHKHEKEDYQNGDDCCCICLTQYIDGVSLKRLPCNHTFHIECVDQWLHINPTCPLCKLNIRAPSQLDHYVLAFC